VRGKTKCPEKMEEQKRSKITFVVGTRTHGFTNRQRKSQNDSGGGTKKLSKDLRNCPIISK
jgi:hypothetical protein